MELAGRRWDDGRPVRIRIRDGRIDQLEPLDASADSSTPPLPWLAPGLIDLQVNGYGGRDFSSEALTADDVLQVGRALLATGVTGFLATVTTQSHQVIIHALETIGAASLADDAGGSHLLGVHLEGPYISSEDGPRGAHPQAHCRAPDWSEFEQFQRASGGRIRLVTLAPELPGAVDFIRRLRANNVLAAIGHTAANSRQIEAAVQAGATLSTHLGNGAHPVLPRHPNYLWDQLADDRLWASLIADGFHLPPSVLKVILRAKGLNRCLLVSDMSALAGRPPGRYRGTGLGDVDILEDGRLVVAGQRTLLAGAGHPLVHGVAHLVGAVGLSLYEAWTLASRRPAEWLGAAPVELAPGGPAELVELERTGPADRADGLRVRAVIRGETRSEGDRVLRPIGSMPQGGAAG